RWTSTVWWCCAGPSALAEPRPTPSKTWRARLWGTRSGFRVRRRDAARPRRSVTMPDTPGRKDRAATGEESTSLGSWAGSWSLDPSRSSLRFRSSALWGLVKVHGEFTDISGEGSVAPDGTVSGRLEIAAASVDTGKAKRDRHLR